MKIYGYNDRCNLCGPRVRQARDQAGLTQEQLAARLQVAGVQVNQKAISRIETGHRVVADYELAALASVLRADVGWLLNPPGEQD